MLKQLPSSINDQSFYMRVRDAPRIGRFVECLLCIDTPFCLVSAHLCNECECSRYLLTKFDFLRTINLRGMLTPTGGLSSDLRKLNWGVKMVRKAY